MIRIAFIGLVTALFVTPVSAFVGSGYKDQTNIADRPPAKWTQDLSTTSRSCISNPDPECLLDVASSLAESVNINRNFIAERAFIIFKREGIEPALDALEASDTETVEQKTTEAFRLIAHLLQHNQKNWSPALRVANMDLLKDSDIRPGLLSQISVRAAPTAPRVALRGAFALKDLETEVGMTTQTLISVGEDAGEFSLVTDGLRHAYRIEDTNQQASLRFIASEALGRMGNSALLDTPGLGQIELVGFRVGLSEAQLEGKNVINHLRVLDARLEKEFPQLVGVVAEMEAAIKSRNGSNKPDLPPGWNTVYADSATYKSYLMSSPPSHARHLIGRGLTGPALVSRMTEYFMRIADRDNLEADMLQFPTYLIGSTTIAETRDVWIAALKSAPKEMIAQSLDSLEYELRNHQYNAQVDPGTRNRQIIDLVGLYAEAGDIDTSIRIAQTIDGEYIAAFALAAVSRALASR